MSCKEPSTAERKYAASGAFKKPRVARYSCVATFDFFFYFSILRKGQVNVYISAIHGTHPSGDFLGGFN